MSRLLPHQSTLLDPATTSLNSLKHLSPGPMPIRQVQLLRECDIQEMVVNGTTRPRVALLLASLRATTLNTTVALQPLTVPPISSPTLPVSQPTKSEKQAQEGEEEELARDLLTVQKELQRYIDRNVKKC